LTEPQTGSDAAAITTTAVRDGDHYVINGAKSFTSNHGAAELYFVAAKTDPTRGHRGVSVFIVEKGTPGFSFGAKDRKMGIAACPTGELFFQDCRVPAANLLGSEGEGFKTVMKALTEERCGNAALSLGNAQGAYEYALNYLKERKVFGEPLSTYQGIQWMLADMAIQLDAARLLVQRAAWLVDQGAPNVVEQIAMAKTFANEASMRITTDCVQLLGGHGYMKDHPVERMMREAKLWAIGGGTTQVQRNILAQQILR
jgi:butyryl-CoA dehydrogenase